MYPRRTHTYGALIGALLLAGQARAQCPQLFDYYGLPSDAPEWYSCSGTAYALLIATPNVVGAYTIDWGDGSPLQSGASLQPPQTVSHVYPATVGSYTVVFTEVATGCTITGLLTMEQSTSASIQIPVGGLTQVCAPHAVEFINSSTNVSPNTVFVWNFGDGSPPLTFDHTNWGQTISHTYLPGTVDCETTVELTAENTCNTLQGGASLATFNPIRIWDIDDASIAPSATLLCWPDNEVTYLNTTDRNCFQQGNIFQRYEYWNFGDYWGTGQDSIIDWTPWPPTFPRTIAYPGIGTYEVTLLDSNYCGIDTATVIIEIVPPPSVTLTVSPDTICAGETAFFNETTTGGANYFQWDFGTGNGFQWTGAGDQAHTYNTPGVYTVRYTASIQGATAGCADTASVQVVVLPRPTAAFTMDQDAACDSITVTFTNTSIDALTQQWSFGDGTFSTDVVPPPHTYTAPGTYTVTLEVTNALGCTHSVDQVVEVFAPPSLAIQVANLCFGEVASFTPVVNTAAGNPVTGYAWDLGDGTTATTEQVDHSYAVAGVYQVTLTVTGTYCGATTTQWVSVQPRPEAIIQAAPVLGCSPLTVQFDNGSTGATNYVWNTGDGMVYTTPTATHTYTNLGVTDTVYTVQLIASSPFGCADTSTVNITVAPGVQASFQHNAQPGCAPLNVQFQNLSTGADSYLWDFGDGTTSTDPTPSHTYINTSFFLDIRTVTLTAYSAAGCQSTVTQQITVYPTPEFTFVATPDSGCSPLTVTFPSVVGAVSYAWDYGDGTTGTGPSPSHTYYNTTTNDQVFVVTLIGANAFGCVDTTTAEVRVFPVPTAHFELSDSVGCHPLAVDITNLSTGADQFTWDYGDGVYSDTTEAVHQHVWNNFAGPGAAQFTVELTATTDRGCTSTASRSITVYPQVIAAFVSDTVGCAPLPVQFANVSTGANSYAWTFGDGAFSALSSPQHTYVNQGLDEQLRTATLVATSSFGCTDTAQRTIRILPQPLAQFVPGVLDGCQPLTVPLQDLSIGGVQYSWDFGNGQQLVTGPGGQTQVYTHTSAAPLDYTVTLLVTSDQGCTDTTSREVTVYPPLQALFTVTEEACSPMVVDIVDGSQGALTLLWNMGDGTTLVGADPQYTYVNNSPFPVQRTITLTATSQYGCTSTYSRTVTIHPVPVADFLATPFTQQFPDATVQLTNSSSAGNWSHQWNYGDGNTSNLQSPGSHTYATWGSFTIQLIVSGALCSDTATQQVTITPPLPTASFLGQGEGCVPLTVQFTNTSLQALSYQWNFGDGGTSTADNPSYTFNVPGVYTVTLTAMGVGGGMNTAVKVDSVVVRPRANAFFVLQPNEVIVPSDPVFTYNLSANASSYWWNFGDGSTSTEFNPVHYYTSPGTFDVLLVANNEWNCPDTFLLEQAVRGEATGDIRFPNAFTPNSDGPTDGFYDPNSFSNDHFFPLYQGVEEYRLEIFNRWGELLFVTEDVRVGWDGWYRGSPAKQDVYVWKAFARFSDGRESVMKGDVTLLR
jgi:gliding motility-associated-like protein